MTLANTEIFDSRPGIDVIDGVWRVRRRREPPAYGRVSVQQVRGTLAISGLLAIGLVYAYSPLAAAGMAAIAFVGFAFAWPLAALALILALTPIQNDLGAGNSPVRFAPAELAMFLALPAALFRVSLRPRIGPTFFPTLLYLAVCLVASLQSLRPSMIVSMFQMGLYMLIAVMVFSNLEHRPGKLARVWDLYILSASVLALIGLATNFQFLGTHKNGWGASLSTALIVVTDQWFRARSKKRKLLMTAALTAIGAALMMTVSRGGWMAAVIGIAVVCVARRQFAALFKITLMLGLVACVGWALLPPELQAYATGFEAGRDNIRLRYESIDFALAQWQKDRLLGVGVGLRKEYDATNIVLLALAETGWAGLLTFIGVHLSVVWMSLRMMRCVNRDGVLFSFGTLAIALLGARFAHGLVDHYWSRGPITCAWAAVGLSTLSFQALRREQGRRRVGVLRLVGSAGSLPSDSENIDSGEWKEPGRRSRRHRLSQRERKRIHKGRPSRSLTRADRRKKRRSQAEKLFDEATDPNVNVIPVVIANAHAESSAIADEMPFSQETIADAYERDEELFAAGGPRIQLPIADLSEPRHPSGPIDGFVGSAAKSFVVLGQAAAATTSKTFEKLIGRRDHKDSGE